MQTVPLTDVLPPNRRPRRQGIWRPLTLGPPLNTCCQFVAFVRQQEDIADRQRRLPVHREAAVRRPGFDQRHTHRGVGRQPVASTQPAAPTPMTM